MLIFFLIVLVVVGGCEQNANKNLTGYYFNRTAGELNTVSVSPDSMRIDDGLRPDRGGNNRTLAGRYGSVNAFSVFKFSTSLVNFRNVEEAFISMLVDNTWNEGEYSFDMFDTVSDWNDSTLIEPDHFLEGLDSPLSSFSNSDSTISKLIFPIDVDLVSSWSREGSILIKESEGGQSMVQLYSDDSTDAPLLNLVRTTTSGARDTTSVTCRDGHYYAFTDMLTGKGVVSEASGERFILHISLPDTMPDLSSVNRSVLSLHIPESTIPMDPMAFAVYRLPQEFTTIDEIDELLSDGVAFSLDPDISRIEIDISPFVNYWNTVDGSNYGLIVQPDGTRVSPNTVVFAPLDSLSITYTTLPEVE